jgi:hypothetical protein
MIPEAEILSDLIGTIYDTTLDRALWSEALRKSADFVAGSAAAIYSKSPGAAMSITSQVLTRTIENSISKNM